MDPSSFNPSTQTAVSYCNTVGQNNSHFPRSDQNTSTAFQQDLQQTLQHGPGIGTVFHRELGFGQQPQFNYQGVWPNLQAATMQLTAGVGPGDVAGGVTQPNQIASSPNSHQTVIRTDAPARTPITKEMMLRHASVIIQNAHAPVQAVYAQMMHPSSSFSPACMYPPPPGPPPQYLVAGYPQASHVAAVPTVLGLMPYRDNPYMQPFSTPHNNNYHPLLPQPNHSVRRVPLQYAATHPVPGMGMAQTQTYDALSASWNGPRGQWMATASQPTTLSVESPTSSISSFSTWSQPATPLDYPCNGLKAAPAMSPCMAQIADSMKGIAVSHPEASVNNEELEYLPDGAEDANTTVMMDSAFGQVEADQAEMSDSAEGGVSEGHNIHDLYTSADNPGPTALLSSPALTLDVAGTPRTDAMDAPESEDFAALMPHAPTSGLSYPDGPKYLQDSPSSDSMDAEETGEIDEAPAKPKRPKTVVDWSDRPKHYSQRRGRGRPPVPPEGSHGEYAKAICVACKRDYLHKKGLEYHMNTDKRPHCSVWCAKQIEPPPGVDPNPKLSRKGQGKGKAPKKQGKSSKKKKGAAESGEKRCGKTKGKSSMPAAA